MLVRGLDLSHHQQTVDFGRMARDGIQFVMLKATQGTGYVDPTFAPRAQQAHDAGLQVGAYHFAEVDTDVIANVSHFLDTVRPTPASRRLLVLDVERLDGMSGSHAGLWSAVFVRLLARETGHRPWVYTNASFANACNLGGLLARDVNLWVASWTSRPQPTLPAGFSTWGMWQFTNSGNVAGITPVDVNLAPVEYVG